MIKRATIAALALATLFVAGCSLVPGAGSQATSDGGSASPAVTDQSDTDTDATDSAAPPVSATGVTYEVVPDRSEASYAVGETFLGRQRDVTAIGKTSAVSGAIILDEGIIQPSTVSVDLTTLKSDQARRDNQVQRALDTRNYPQAIYRITGAEGDPVLTEGQEVPIKLMGTMTIKGTDQPLTFEGTAKLEGDTLTIHAASTFNMTAFGVDPPNIVNFVAVQEEVTVEVIFVGQKQG